MAAEEGGSLGRLIKCDEKGRSMHGKRKTGNPVSGTILTCLGLLLAISPMLVQENALARYQEFRRAAVEAQGKGEYRAALDHYRKLLEMVPQKPDIHYRVAVVLAILGDSQGALGHLKKAISLGFPIEELDPAFDSLKEAPGYPEVAAMIEASKKPVGKSRAAFTIPERDLLPEGIAYDPGEGCFYLGSLWKNKIVRVGRDGKGKDFTAEGQDGLRSVAGLKVDPKHRILWALSFVSSPWAKNAEEEAGWSAVFKYDLGTGRLIKKYEFTDKRTSHLLNDLAVTRSGDVFVTDSIRNEVYSIFHDGDSLKSFFRSDEFMYTNGITLGADDRSLYVSSPGNGVYRIDIPSKECRLVSHPETMTLSGIDGLYFYDHSLIGVQPSLNRVARYFLNQKGDAVEGLEIIDARNPLFNFPTTGTIAGSTFYYIANSQAYSFNPDGSLYPPEKLKEVVILRADL
jgi:sugar lactone lactonase YvrE